MHSTDVTDADSTESELAKASRVVQVAWSTILNKLGVNKVQDISYFFMNLYIILYIYINNTFKNYNVTFLILHNFPCCSLHCVSHFCLQIDVSSTKKTQKK